MALNDIKIIKIKKGLNRPAASEDSTSAMVFGAPTTSGSAGSIGWADPKLFYGVEDAEDYGITSTYDTTNNVLVWHHISEYFRMASGQPLYVYFVTQSTTLQDMVDKANTTGLAHLLNLTDGAIRQAAVVLNPLPGYTPTITDGLSSDVLAAIPNAQALADEVYSLHYPVDIIIEGRDFGVATPSDAKDLRLLDRENVSVVIAQDLAVCATHALHEGYAAVGTYLGMVASKNVATSPAEVGISYQGNIQTLAAPVRFLNYGMGNQALSTYSLTAQGVFYDRHYVTPRIFQGTKGVYFAQSFTCAADTNDFIFIELSRVHNKAHRGIYNAFVPYVNTKFRLTEQGYIPAEVVAMLEDIGNQVFAAMQANGEVSSGFTVINPQQSILTTRKLIVQWKAVPMGKLEAVEGELSFTVSAE